MVKYYLLLFSILFSFSLHSQVKIEFDYVKEVRIIKPSLSNLLNIVDMNIDDFQSQLLANGFNKYGTTDDMIGFSSKSGSYYGTGDYTIDKSEFRAIISIIWMTGSSTYIFENLKKELRSFFKEIKDSRMVFEITTTTGKSYNILMSKEDKSETLLVTRTK